MQSPKMMPSYIKNSHGSRSRVFRSGYQQFESIWVNMDEADLSYDVAARHGRGTTVQVVPETDALPEDNPVSGGDSSAHTMNSDHFDGVYGKLHVLQNANTTFKRKVAAQSQEIDVLKRENLKLCKLLAERKRAESDASPNPLLSQLLTLKEELDKTRHRLLQYEIFDEHSEVDINGLLNTNHGADHHPTTTATSMRA